MIIRQRVTIKDIAKRAGISHQAVSYVLNDKMHMVGAATREKVLQLVKEMNYIPNHQARSLKTRRSGVVGLFCPQTDSVHPYILTMQNHLARELAGRNVRSMLMGSFKNTDDTLRMYKSGQADGFVYFLTAGALDVFVSEVAPVLNEHKVPFVLVHGTSSVRMDFPNVGLDNASLTERAVTKLIARGFTRIGFVSHFPTYPAPKVEALDGFCAALDAAGVKYDQDRVFDGEDLRAGYEAVYAMHRASAGPFALYCYNSEVALAAARAVADLGLELDKDVALVAGGPNVVNPLLTEVLSGGNIDHAGQSNEARAHAAVHMLTAVIEGKYEGPTRILFGSD